MNNRVISLNWLSTSFLTLLAIFWPSHAVYAWGKTGHRVAAELAETYFNPQTRLAVNALLSDETLAEVSTFADEMRSDPSEFWQKTASPWHYVTVPEGLTYDKLGAPPQGDAVTALERFAATLRNPDAALDDKRLALKFAAHIVADLHQPLHVGNGRDRGGNDFQVRFFDRPTNLHAVWDEGLIDHEKWSYSELAGQLARHNKPTEVLLWLDPNPQTWIAESLALRNRIYPAGRDLRWEYVFQHLPEVELRLRQSGVRLAAWLNQVFDRQTTARILAAVQAEK